MCSRYKPPPSAIASPGFSFDSFPRVPPQPVPRPPCADAVRPSSRHVHTALLVLARRDRVTRTRTPWPAFRQTETSSQALQRPSTPNTSLRRRVSAPLPPRTSRSSMASTTASSSPPRRRSTPSAAFRTRFPGVHTVSTPFRNSRPMSPAHTLSNSTVIAVCELAERFSYYGTTVVFVSTPPFNHPLDAPARTNHK